MILGITGHRPPGLNMGYEIPNPKYKKVYQALVDKFKEMNPESIISGMALGTDQIAACVAIDLKIPFICAVPFKGQELKWPRESQQRFNSILDLAKQVVIVSPGGYSPDKLHIRDQWIVDNSDQLLGVWNGVPKGGTYKTICFARNRNKKITIIDSELL